MRRGFKAQAERLALKHRAEFGVSPDQKLDPVKFLGSKGIIVWEPKDIPGLAQETLRHLTEVDPDAWSGMTLREGTLRAIIINSAHGKPRKANTLMHEWAHIELNHKPNRADRSEGGLLLLSDYPSDIEDEADWLAGCMLAPRDGLLNLCRQGYDVDQVAGHYGISSQLARWRIGKTGIRRQLGNRY